MSVFKKPSEMQAKPGIVAMIYGSPGSGKSTLACSAPGAVMIDADHGALRVNGAHLVPNLRVENWMEVTSAIEEVRNDPQIQSVIIDTVGKMMYYMEDHIKRTATGKKPELNWDGSLSLKGFGKRKQMFVDLINSLTSTGKNVIFVAHDKEEKRGDAWIVRPEVGGSSTNDLMKELDLVGYMEMNGDMRTISFTPTDRYYAKNTCDMPGVIPIPMLIDKDGNLTGSNDFFGRVISSYRERMSRSIENNRRLEELRGQIKESVEGIDSAEKANEFVGWVEGLEHVYNSKAIALDLFLKKTKALGLKYDAKTKKYADADS